MKQLLLPIALITFTIICFTIVHLDNINTLKKKTKNTIEKTTVKQGIELQNDHLSIKRSV